ncbi:MAG: NYN domain-containing protein [Promethearchaeota archaeon]
MVKLNIIVDGSNVAFFKRDNKKKARLKNLEILLSFLEDLSAKLPIKYEVIIDASLRYRIDNKPELENLCNTGKILQCPSKIQADVFLLEYFKHHPEETVIISNDNFSEFQEINPVVCKFMIILDEMIILPNLSSLFSDIVNIQIEGKAIA